MFRFMVIVAFSMILLSSCSKSDQPIQDDVAWSLQNCPRDNKICADGSIVMRLGPDCEFEKCPEVPDDFCDYGNPGMDYWGRNGEQCRSNTHECESWEKPFSNKCGCGCELPEWATGGTFCQEGDRYYEYCQENDDPVCGVFYQGKGNCNDEWCMKTFSNRCEACKNSEVLYAAVGECLNN